VISRPLGKAPILRKSVNGCIHSTSLDLVLECRVDGEYSEFYSAAPGEYIVALFRGNTQIWQGTLVTELYSAPEIAPPYDVNITANDGIALEKEFRYEAHGAITPKALVRNLLADLPGIGRSIYIVSGIGATDLTEANFWNTAVINLDYMVGESKYDVLTYFLESIHASITMHDGNWLIVRETDVTISNGAIPCLLAPRNSSSISSSSLTGVVKSAGQMGVADLWPIGHMSTNVSPAKRRVTIEAPYHVMSGAPSVANNGWSIYDPSHATFLGGSYILTYATNDDDYGEVYAQIPIRSFTRDLRLSIKVSTYLAYVYTNKSDLKIYVTFTPTGGSPKYYNGLAWSTTAEVFQNPELTKPVGTVETPEDFSFDISPLAEFADGTLDITFVGRRVQLYDAVLETIIGKGHKDTIIINNGARGDGDTVEIAGARVTSNDVVASSFLQGIFLHPDASPVEGFFDNNFSGPLSFMSLTAMGYALSVALPRLELTGLFNVPTTLSTVPLVVTYGGVNYWVESFDLNVLEEELTLTARSLPSATLSVESETITELTDEDARGGSSSGGGGGGGGGGSYTLPIASANTLGGVKVGTGLSIDPQTGVLSSSGGGGGGGSVTSVGLSMPTGFSVQGSPVTGQGTFTVDYANGYSLPTTAKQEAWDNKQSQIDDLSTIRSNASHGQTAYGWGNHADAGYADADEVENALALKQDEITDLSTIRNNAGKGATAYGWGDHSQAGYANADDVEEALDGKQDKINDLGDIRSNANKGATAYGWGDHAQEGYAHLTDLEDYVTLATQQTITGEKTFTTKPVHIGSSSGIDVDGSSYIDIGDARLKWDAETHSLYVTKRPGSSYSGDINICTDGDVSSGGAAGGAGNVKYVNLANQTAYNNLSTKDPATIYTIGSPVTKVYLGTIQLYPAV